jgi:hypothetical protein
MRLLLRCPCAAFERTGAALGCVRARRIGTKAGFFGTIDDRRHGGALRNAAMKYL